MKNLKFLFLFLLFSCVGGGSGGGSGSGGNEAQSSSSNFSVSDLNGEYNLSQQENICFNLENSSQAVVTVIKSNTLHIQEYGFSLLNCYGTPSYVLEAKASMLKINSNEVRLNTLSQTLKVTTSSAANDANAAGACGIYNWVSDEARNIEGTSCEVWDRSSFTWHDVRKSGNIITLKNDDGDNLTLYPFKKKSILSSWTKAVDSSYTLDFSSLTYEEAGLVTLKTTLSSSWLSALNSAGRDTTGLVAGQTYLCEAAVEVYPVGTPNDSLDEIGYIYVNVLNDDTPLNNACLEQDNDSTLSGYNYNSPHIYYVFGDKAYVDYFGSADSFNYLVDLWY